MRKKCLVKIISVSLILIALSTSRVYPQEMGISYPQPQVGSTLVTTENLKDILEILKGLQSSISELQKNLIETLGRAETSKFDIESLKREVKVVKELLEGLQGELFKRLDEESKLAKEEFLTKLDFLTTVMRRAMVVFKNVEDLTKEAQTLKEQLLMAGEELKKLAEFSKKGFEDNKENQSKMIALLIVNLILLSFLVFLQLEKTFRRYSKKESEPGS